MVNRPPNDPRYAPLQTQPKRPRPLDGEQIYVNEGQFLNQGHYENAEQVHHQIDQDLNSPYPPSQPDYGAVQPQAADHHGSGQRQSQAQGHGQAQGQGQAQGHGQAQGQGHLRQEFVQGSEYQQPPSDQNPPFASPQAHALGEQVIEDENPKSGVGSIATFGNSLANKNRAPSKLSPIIPRDSIIGKSILFIIVAMCFLASLSIVFLLLVQSSVDGWTSDIGKQATVQILPSPERDVDADIATALKIIRATNGIALAEPLTKNETAKLLEPWIGDGIIGQDANNNDISILDELPIPALIALEFIAGHNVDLNLLDVALKSAIPGASVDDHKKWLSHLSSIGNILKISAFAVLALVIGITITIIVFATDAALNSNKTSIEILFLVGAEEGFITKEVRYHFLWLGLKAGVFGAFICIAFILLLGLVVNIIYAAQFDNLAAARILFGQVTLSPYQYLYLLLVPLFTTIIAGITVHLSARKIINTLH
ncbi:MAG: hypothetical protein HRU29_15000 [Rhizobiales bacterium]|nr:hypothetical protein [Hyphomicrobiales bacterium]NRB15703.1 hypothetical protein [Hyphomicrobiales bacterium]